jgi:hypothetical protein
MRRSFFDPIADGGRCEEYLTGQYDIEVIDLLHTPALAQGDQIFVNPRLVRKLLGPVRKSQCERLSAICPTPNG